jgi:hypothetical protein
MKTFKYYMQIIALYALTIIMLLPVYVFVFGILNTSGLKTLLLRMAINTPIGILLLLFIPMLLSTLILGFYFAKKAIDMQVKRDSQRMSEVLVELIKKYVKNSNEENSKKKLKE